MSSTEPNDHAPRALRVSQLDAIELDTGFLHSLQTKITQALALFSPGSESALNPEIGLLLKCLVWTLAISDPRSPSTPGQKLQNLKFEHERPRSFLRHIFPRIPPTLHLPLISLLPSYLLTRLHDHTIRNNYPQYPRKSWARRLWVSTERLLALGRVWEGVGMGWFLIDGAYPTLHHRLLRLAQRPIRDPNGVGRSVSYEYMERQLVWTGFTEFLIFLLPLLRTSTVRRVLHRVRSTGVGMAGLIGGVVRGVGVRDYTVAAGPAGSSSSSSSSSRSQLKTHSSGIQPDRTPTRGRGRGREKGKGKGKYHHLPLGTCAICHHRLYGGLGELGLPVLSVHPGLDLGSDEGSQDTREVREGEEKHVQTGGNDLDVNVDPDVNADVNGDGGEGNEETRIHLSTRTDCREGCVWCYRCIASELVRLARDRVAVRGTQGAQGGREEGNEGNEGETDKGEKGWECLRCGDEVWGCQRIDG